MNETERNSIEAVGLELIVLVLRLCVIVLYVFVGLLTLGLLIALIAYWYIVFPVLFIFAWWLSSSNSSRR